MASVKGLRENLRNGAGIVCAGGYHRELEKRGHVGIGKETPEVILHNPSVLRLVHEDLVHNGSDVVQAYTSYCHRLHLKSIGQEANVETLNRAALRIARQVAEKTGTLLAGSVCSLHLFDPDDPSTIELTQTIFKEQIEFAVEEGADFIIGESFTDFGEAKIALESIKQYGLPAVITLTIHCPEKTTDDIPVQQALRSLEELGADAVGLNCARGPCTMMPLLREARKVCKGPLAALPVPFRTSDKEKTWMTLKDPLSGKSIYPLDVDMALCNRQDVRRFAEEAKALGIQYIGLCCGTNPSYIRELAEAYGKKPKSSAFGPNLNPTIMHNPNPTPYILKKRKYMLGTWQAGVA